MSQSIWKNKNTIAELSRISGLKYQTIYQRVKVLNWNKVVAINTPVADTGIYKKQLKKLNGNCSR